MKRKLINLFCGILLSLPLSGYAQQPYDPNTATDSTLVSIDLFVGITNPTIPGNEIHRTPPLSPIVYLDYENNTLYFEEPCYECTLEIVVPGTDNVAYTYSIPDGDNVVTLPEWLSGQYELHIHRGNFCFWGLIEL